MINISPQVVNALETYYWKKTDKRPLAPVRDMIEFIYSAWQSKLDMKEECLYSGSVLLHSIIKHTGRDYTYDLKEANDIFLAGRTLALQLTGILDKSKDDSPDEIYKKFKKELEEQLLKKYEEVRKK